jgi:ribose transport system ATP-binding protein
MDTVLTALNVVKHYAGVVALAEGNLTARPGEVVALMGANGSGKSTLCKIITGVVAPGAGQLLLNDEPVAFRAPYEALDYGIAAVYQELSLVPTMTVSENIWLTREPRRGQILLDKKERRARTADLIRLFEGCIRVSLTPDTLVGTLPPDEQQIVEILKALSTDPRVLILDEATSSLDNRQVTRLFELITQWKESGRAIVFISHRMGEIFRVADHITVLRNGRTVGDELIGNITEAQLVKLMIVQDIVDHRPATPVVAGEPETKRPILLEVDGITTSALSNTSFNLREGELLGIGGLQGQGQTDVLKAIFGATPFSGMMRLRGKPYTPGHPREAMAEGLAFVPGDRAREGLLFRTTIFENLLLPDWKKYGFPLRIGAARATAKETTQSLSVVMDGIDMPVSSLSGGNAQKIVIGKWLQRSPQLLLLNDPTKGVDVGSKREFYDLLAELQTTGTSIILYSSDDEELVRLCDRVLVMHSGAVREELAGSRLTLTNLVAASLDVSGEGMD